MPASIGVAAPAAPGEHLEVDELLRLQPHVAMYHAKAQGKNCLATHDPTIDVVPGSTDSSRVSA